MPLLLTDGDPVTVNCVVPEEVTIVAGTDSCTGPDNVAVHVDGAPAVLTWMSIGELTFAVTETVPPAREIAPQEIVAAHPGKPPHAALVAPQTSMVMIPAPSIL